MRHVLFVCMFFLLSFSVSRSALAEGMHPSRAPLLLHGSHELKEGQRKILFHFVPSANLNAGIFPLTFLSLQEQVTNWLAIEPTLGFHFAAEEPILAMRFAPKGGNFWSWTDLEYRLPSHNGYWFTQIQLKLNDYLHTGFEGEGWGSLEDSGSWSHGAGPNILLRTGKLGGDFALHARYLNGRTAPEFFLRAHVFL